MTQYLLSSNPHNLLAALALHGRSATVEAEYGDVLVRGSVLTMAHHGRNAGQPAPCSYPNDCWPMAEKPLAIGLSHFDLDTLGGILAINGLKPEVPGFWELVEFFDLNGLHKLPKYDAGVHNQWYPRCTSRLHAFLAWNKKNPMYAPKDGSVAEIGDYILKATEIILRICADDEILLQEGDQFRENRKALNKNTFLEFQGGVILRVGPESMNDLYVTPDNQIAEAVVGFNTITGGITVSFAEPPPHGMNAKDIVQAIFGAEAGGHAGIAGSPRDRRCDLDELNETFKLTRKVIKSLND